MAFPSADNRNTTVVEMHQLSPETLRTRRPQARVVDENENIVAEENEGINHDNGNNDDDDDTDGAEGKEALRRLLSPQGALVADLASEIVSRMTSAERTQTLASMSRSRYMATQCVAIVLSLIGLAAVAVFALVSANNTPLGDLLLHALNQTLLRQAVDNEDESD